MQQLHNYQRFLVWFGETYHAFKSRKPISNNNELIIKYKIGNSFPDYRKTGKILVQSRKGAAYAYYTPKQIYNDPSLIGGFHPIDAATITNLYLNPEKKLNPEVKANAEQLFRVSKVYHCKTKKQYIYEIENISNHEISAFTLSELQGQHEILNNLIPTEALQVGFHIGAEYMKIRNKL